MSILFTTILVLPGIVASIRPGISEIITGILEKAEQPLTREEIVKQVLRVRKVKETTILLNLQNKKLFKKVDRNSYTIA